EAATRTTPTASRGSRQRDEPSRRAAGASPTEMDPACRVDAPSPPSFTIASHPVLIGRRPSLDPLAGAFRELLCPFFAIRPDRYPQAMPGRAYVWLWRTRDDSGWGGTLGLCPSDQVNPASCR